MVENLKTTKYNDGTSVPLVTNNSEWENLSSGAYCWYENNISNKQVYGALYNWYAVDTKKLAPTGWHVPTDAEWNILITYLVDNRYNWDGTTTENKIAKSIAAKTEWASFDELGTPGNEISTNNKTGFSGLPGGCRPDGYAPSIQSYGITYCSYWWSSIETEACCASLYMMRYDFPYFENWLKSKQFGNSVRCIRDY
jgi:uncharacterized protein (TIGR02145 family)